MYKNIYVHFLLFSFFIFTPMILLFTLKFKLHLLIAYLLSVNITLLFLYMYDKICSLFSWLRVPEKILHLLTLLGATPMAFLAQKLFSHKTSKLSFQKTFFKIVLVQVFVGLVMASLIFYMA